MIVCLALFLKVWAIISRTCGPSVIITTKTVWSHLPNLQIAVSDAATIAQNDVCVGFYVDMLFAPGLFSNCGLIAKVHHIFLGDI